MLREIYVDKHFLSTSLNKKQTRFYFRLGHTHKMKAREVTYQQLAKAGPFV